MKNVPTVIIDTREQAPWTFDRSVLETARRALPAGDYSLAGLEHAVAVERKSLDDFVGSVIHDWARFRRELCRLAAMECTCVIVEANVGDVIAKAYKSDVAPLSIIGRAHAIYLDYGIPVFFAGPRPLARLIAERFLLLADKKLNHLRENNENKNHC